ncbi:hypothetical protein FNV43_RR14590 [Rhamnella rubrinervis]|uniref:Peptidoglycan binding-like domain-containing protein n=1 Tax=Rhamnella rubrinervis TaxID=2594499 RepID=A0A8K0H379_9ROSA|nr:hypothetical protein FNV43_RR14590 [Rhamnella rubrinervis]
MAATLVMFIFVIQLLHLVVDSSMSAPYDSDSLRSLEGLSKGQAHQAILHLKRYLHHFGYLKYMDKSRLNDDYYDEVLESAVRLFQKFFHLELTGMLDSTTIKLMTTPRCGDPDPVQAIIG